MKLLETFKMIKESEKATTLYSDLPADLITTIEDSASMCSAMRGSWRRAKAREQKSLVKALFHFISEGKGSIIYYYYVPLSEESPDYVLAVFVSVRPISGKLAIFVTTLEGNHSGDLRLVAKVLPTYRPGESKVLRIDSFVESVQSILPELKKAIINSCKLALSSSTKLKELYGDLIKQLKVNPTLEIGSRDRTLFDVKSASQKGSRLLLQLSTAINPNEREKGIPPLKADLTIILSPDSFDKNFTPSPDKDVKFKYTILLRSVTTLGGGLYRRLIRLEQPLPLTSGTAIFTGLALKSVEEFQTTVISHALFSAKISLMNLKSDLLGPVYYSSTHANSASSVKIILDGNEQEPIGFMRIYQDVVVLSFNNPHVAKSIFDYLAQPSKGGLDYLDQDKEGNVIVYPTPNDLKKILALTKRSPSQYVAKEIRKRISQAIRSQLKRKVSFMAR